ncbi:ATP-dependent DNA helicase RecG [Lichenifustis flavocetrariae]|uniref:Probable DNA 3'-5' helicase RecG n=1 Tax=Lichenifustis flavocetrariae TaxID=2949735 RepID=A0AA41YXA5_9HYPH|nr:ATP-dependent DNA helicase RecG [Lichenifustis flavocetrariae]MCW6510289.1 ATP-dependent DNA helicase RecG [Lichenifustis flavocetrariae]
MRPTLLNPLFTAAKTLHGVGAKIAPLLDRLVGRDARTIDLVFHLPTGVIDRRSRPKIAEAQRDQVVTLEVRVVNHQPPGQSRSGKAPFKVLVEDETGDVTLIFFHNSPAWIAKSLPVGATRWISGRLDQWDGHLQMVHPDRVMTAEEVATMPAVEPIYGLTEGLFPRVLSRIVADALARVPVLPEWLDENRVILRGWPAFHEAIARLHGPQTPVDVEATSPAHQRLAYDELLASQLALASVRGRLRQADGRRTLGTGVLAGQLEAILPFRLTDGQAQALAEIRADLAAPERMLRLLQGDVGSGKTVVALLAMVTSVEAGRQAALMVPTEILARQHFERLAALGAQVGIRVTLVTGRDKPKEREAKLAALAAGETQIVVGTHALFTDPIAFRDLGLVVVDEQHRFGVNQRLALAEKGTAADMLVMTATPIPRTLVMTVFGDMDVSILREKPAGRQPITTVLVNAERLEDVVAGLARAIRDGARVYWVCPLVTESEFVDLVAAEDRYRALREAFGDAVRLVHGQMKPAEKDAAMADFAAGRAQILVATTVIEVGVDVPEASIIVIEHAERFGLAQLHQLRGRVGRGQAKSSCVLVYKGPLGETSEARLRVMRDTEDGFVIAEEDLRLRGEGELIGTRQSGLPTYRVARLDAHGSLLAAAREEAAAIFAADPHLQSERGERLRTLLYLFERDAAVRLLSAG